MTCLLMWESYVLASKGTHWASIITGTGAMVCMYFCYDITKDQDKEEL